jgi:drug/metabolite transporter (DMT)-like permease
VLAVALALSSSVIWGVCDFFGALAARRYSVAAIVVLVQFVGLVGAAAVAALAGGSVTSTGVLLGLAAGVFGSISIGAFYTAMVRGLISVASPLLACGSVLAFALAVAAGERPSALAIFGCALAVTGAVLTSLERQPPGGQAQHGALAYAVAAAIAFGFALFLLGRASQETGGSVAVLAQRTSSSVLLLALAAQVRPSLRIQRRWLGVIAGIGLGTTLALLLYGLAVREGMLSIVSILASMSPVVTVLLAHAVLGERLRPHQVAGVSLALIGIALLSAGR